MEVSPDLIADLADNPSYGAETADASSLWTGLTNGPADYEVKSWPWFFEEMIAGRKKHDMRDMRDREYKVGDLMLLREFDPRTGQYTGRSARALITYITSNSTPCAMSSSALDNDYAILSVSIMQVMGNL